VFNWPLVPRTVNAPPDDLLDTSIRKMSSPSCKVVPYKFGKIYGWTDVGVSSTMTLEVV